MASDVACLVVRGCVLWLAVKQGLTVAESLLRVCSSVIWQEDNLTQSHGKHPCTKSYLQSVNKEKWQETLDKLCMYFSVGIQHPIE